MHDARCKGNGGTNFQGKAWQGAKWCRPERRLSLYIRDRFECQCCGRDLRKAKSEEMGLDHLIPRVRGGCNCASNLMTICKPCNASRGSKSWTQFYPAGAILRVRRQQRRIPNIAQAKSILAGTARLRIER